IFQVLTWEDIIREKAAWDTMTWFAVLYMMATALSAYGFIDWVSDVIAGSLGALSWLTALILLVVIYFFAHYFFASATAHISDLIFQVLTWEDIIREKAAWDTMTWFAVLYMMATALSAYGFIDWVSDVIAGSLGALSWLTALILLVVIYFFAHYFFASATAHI